MMKRKTNKRLGCITNSKPQTHSKPKLTLFLFCLHLGFGVHCLAASEPANAPPAEQGRPAVVPGPEEPRVDTGCLADRLSDPVSGKDPDLVE